MLWRRVMLCTLEIRGVCEDSAPYLLMKKAISSPQLMEVVAWQRMDGLLLRLQMENAYQDMHLFFSSVMKPFIEAFRLLPKTINKRVSQEEKEGKKHSTPVKIITVIQNFLIEGNFRGCF